MLVLTIMRRKKYGFNIFSAVLFTLVLLILGIGGAKLLYILEHPGEPISKNPGGVSFFGSVYLIPLLMPLFGFIFKLRPKSSHDASAPCVAAMIGCIRVGCFLNGCCGGWTTPWGFTWPTQTVESICDFMLMFFLLQIEKKEKYKGWLYPLFLSIYSSYRFVIEFFRNTAKNSIGLSNGHIFALIGILTGGLWMLFLYLKIKKTAKSV